MTPESRPSAGYFSERDARARQDAVRAIVRGWQGLRLAPKRIQRQRTKGWRMPENAVYVGRPSKWGNPFVAYKCDCCGYWDVRDDNDVTYLVNHAYVRQPHVRADRRTWTTHDEARAKAVELYNCELTYWVGGRMAWDPAFAESVHGLRGHDLACWCPLDAPCHADVLLALANQEKP